MLGGIFGYLVTDTTDQKPEQGAAVQRLTWAYPAADYDYLTDREQNPKTGAL